MNINDWISSYHGMELDPIARPDWRGNENGILFLVYYFYLKDILGTLTDEDIKTYQQIVINLRTYDENSNQIRGLFDRGAKESLNPDKESIRTISHDNLSAISLFSKMLEHSGLAYHKEIADYGREHFWRFDNVYPDKPRWSRIQHPRDIVFWSYIDGKIWSNFFMWFVILNCFISCFSKEKDSQGRYVTSGRLLTFLRLYPYKNKLWGRLTWKICTYAVNKRFQNGWLEVFNIYFGNPEHPINLLAKEAYEKKKELF